MIEERYREIIAAVDLETARNRALHGRKLHCRPGCDECCHHIFSITPIEAAECDGLSKQYQDLLSGSYDCVDRIVFECLFSDGP